MRELPLLDAPATSAPETAKTLGRQVHTRRQVTAEGSLSSAASSSGCSSATECSSSGFSAQKRRHHHQQQQQKQVEQMPEVEHLHRLPMSEFSAASLRKSLRTSSSTRIQSTAATATATPVTLNPSLRRAATFRQVESQLANIDYCCCCSGDCKATGLMSQTSFAGRNKMRRRSVAQNNTTSPLVATRAALLSQTATVAAQHHFNQRPQQARRPMPVPPPVVPLYKEIALRELEVSGSAKQVEVVEPLNNSLSVHDLLLTVGSHSSPTSSSSPYSSSSSSSAAAAASTGDVSDSSDNSTARRLFKRSYGENWRELRATHSCLDVRALSTTTTTTTQVNCSSRPGELTRTLGRRTGRFLWRLKQSLINNFAADLAAVSAVDKQCPKQRDEGEAAAAAVAAHTEIYDTPEFDASHCKTRQSTPTRKVQRPAIPPPPPPPQQQIAKQSEPQAQRNLRRGVECDCALTVNLTHYCGRKDNLLDVSFESITLDSRPTLTPSPINSNSIDNQSSRVSGSVQDERQQQQQQERCNNRQELSSSKQQQQQHIRGAKSVKWVSNSQQSESVTDDQVRQIQDCEAELRIKKGILLKQLQRRLSISSAAATNTDGSKSKSSKPTNLEQQQQRDTKLSNTNTTGQEMGAQSSDLLDKSGANKLPSDHQRVSATNGRASNGHVKLTSCDVSIKSLSLMTNKLVSESSSKQSSSKTINGNNVVSVSEREGNSNGSPATSNASQARKNAYLQHTQNTNGPHTSFIKLAKGRLSNSDKIGNKTYNARRQSVTPGKAAAWPQQQQQQQQHTQLQQQQQQQQPLTLPSIEESLEKRRKSIQNGDVFIYPSLYKHLNECPKCLRDNRVCNCNPLDLWHNNVDDDADVYDVASRSSALTEESLEQSTSDSFKQGTGEAFVGGRGQIQLQQEQQQQQQMKSVYKISIATATIDQKSNQLRLSPATTIVPETANSQSVLLNQSTTTSYLNHQLEELQPAARPRTSTLREKSLYQDTSKAIHYSTPDTTQLTSVQLIKDDPDKVSKSSTSSTRYTQNAISLSPPDRATCNELKSANDRMKSPNALHSVGANSVTFDDLPLPLQQQQQQQQQNLNQQQHLQKSHLKTSIIHSEPSERSKLFLFSSEIKCNDAEKSGQESPTSSLCNTTVSVSGSCEANVTAVSIGSPTRSPANVNLEKILSPLIVADQAINCNKPLVTDLNNNNNNNSNNSGNISLNKPKDEHSDEAVSAKCDTVYSNETSAQPCLMDPMATNFVGFIKKEEQLTCNLDIGDTIKITSASIRFATNPLPSTNEASKTSITAIADRTHTSVVPIQTLSSRRKNINNRLSRQVIHEDDDSNDCANLQQLPPQQIQLLANPLLVADNTDDKNKTSSDVLEYSPILSSVRDYIQNVNTKLQVQSASTSPIPVVNDELIQSSYPVETSLVVTSISQPSSVVASEAIQTSTGVVQATTFTTVNNVELESPKKSIFEGASKDEILEYLEDARERVPEILMAADDVMVLNENELIVVNQLEPNSPATPISIVEAAEVIDGTKPAANSTNDIQTHPDQLRQHLQQMFRTSQLSTSLQLSSTENTADEDNCGTTDRTSPLSRLESTFDSIDAPSSASSQLYGQIRPGSAQKSFSCITGATIESLDDQVVVSEVSNPEDNLQTSHLTSPLLDQNDSRPEVEASLNPLVEDRNSVNMSSFDSPSLFSNRRNSLSGNSNQLARVCELRMMKLQQRYSNRDSISSASSTPPSSTSPSSSTSSNQTSGNCSAASTFYASSSLSCSSPLLANNLSFNSPAFHKCPTLGQNSVSKYDFDGAPTYGAQILESLIREVKIDSTVEVIDLRIPTVDRDDSGLGPDSVSKAGTKQTTSKDKIDIREISAIGSSERNLIDQTASVQNLIESVSSDRNQNIKQDEVNASVSENSCKSVLVKGEKKNGNIIRFGQPTFSSSANLMSRTLPGHYASRLNNYFMNRHPLGNTSESTIEFQCLDCDQFIDVDQVTILNKTNEIRLINERDTSSEFLTHDQGKSLSPDQLDRAYIAAMNGLPLCKSCEKKRIERKEIISEFVETELKYGRDLKIIHDEFYRPMQIAGLLSKDQIRGVFLNLEELIMAHCKFADRLETAISEAHSMGDTDYNTVNIGRLFVDSAEMLHTFESYCIRQGSAACLLARLDKEKELLRIFLRVSQMENTLLRRMNLAAFLMVPVQRVTKYPLLLNRLYKVTAYHHKDREALRDAQLKVELHLEHINQQTKGVGATNKIWRRISNLSAPISNRPRLINSEDIGYIKLRKTAMDMLKWDRDETQFIHSGRINFAPLNEFLIKQKMKPLRYMAAHALLIVLGKPNWKYRPDLVKSNLDSKLMTPTPGGNGVKEAALLLFREKNGRFVPCREPLYLSNCVFSTDCSQFNSECPLNQTNHHSNSKSSSASQGVGNSNKPTSLSMEKKESGSFDSRASSTDLNILQVTGKNTIRGVDGSDQRSNSVAIDSVSMSSMKSLPDDQSVLSSSPPTVPSSRSYSLASALPRTTIPTNNVMPNLIKSTSTTSSNLTILNQLMTKVNSYHKQTSSVSKTNLSEQSKNSTSVAQSPVQHDQSNQTQITIEALPASQTCTNNHVSNNSSSITQFGDIYQNHYNHHYFHNHHNPYGDYEESFEIHERVGKESMLLRADTPLKTRYWLQMLRYHAKDLGQWRSRRNALANIMMMRHE